MKKATLLIFMLAILLQPVLAWQPNYTSSREMLLLSVVVILHSGLMRGKYQHRCCCL
mgnify:CR=1 FL=1